MFLRYEILLLCFLNKIVRNEDLSLLNPSQEFSRYTLIKPTVLHGREKREITSTKEDGTESHVFRIHVSYNVNGTNYLLDLTLNRDILAKDYFHKYREGGTSTVRKLAEKDVELCQYKGTIRDIKDSWAAISTCQNGLSGLIFDGKEQLYLQKATNDNGSDCCGYHFLYKRSDLLEIPNRTCLNEPETDESGVGTGELLLRRTRALNVREITGPYSMTRKTRFVELVFVVDMSLYEEFGRNLRRVYQHCKDIVNVMNGLYSSLNVIIALVGVDVWNNGNEIQFSGDSAATLDSFLRYRRQKLLPISPNDNAQLLTKHNFENSVVGKAYTSFICTVDKSGGVNTDHSNLVGLVAETVAHEMGHNLGMEHDQKDCSCASDRCIMSPISSSEPSTTWSSCSRLHLEISFSRHLDYCLRNKPQSLFDGPLCGNGFVEDGEECDCGPQECACCNTDCTLHSGAVCATGECCDFNTCQFKPAASVCRSAEVECDLPEYCNGTSEYCPSDIFKMDTSACKGGKAYCYQGSCKTRDEHCQLLWGSTGKSAPDQCYNSNTQENRLGNCGYDWIKETFRKCEKENILCGMINCVHGNEKLEFGLESAAISAKRYIQDERQVLSTCYSVLVDLGVGQIDPGLTPNGIQCGNNKICVDQKCIDVENLKPAGNFCSQDCSGNGVCNSLGRCHCNYGFSPPNCDVPGPGGSEHSGPAYNDTVLKYFVMAMYIVFVGIIPLAAIIVIALHRLKRNLPLKENSLVSGAWKPLITFDKMCCQVALDKCMCCGKNSNQIKSDSAHPDVLKSSESKIPDKSHRSTAENVNEKSTTMADQRAKPTNRRLSILNMKNFKVNASLFSKSKKPAQEPNTREQVSSESESDFDTYEEPVYENVAVLKTPYTKLEEKKKNPPRYLKGLKVNVNIPFKSGEEMQEPSTSETVCSESEFDYKINPISVKDMMRRFEKS